MKLKLKVLYTTILINIILINPLLRHRNGEKVYFPVNTSHPRHRYIYHFVNTLGKIVCWLPPFPSDILIANMPSVFGDVEPLSIVRSIDCMLGRVTTVFTSLCEQQRVDRRLQLPSYFCCWENVLMLAWGWLVAMINSFCAGLDGLLHNESLPRTLCLCVCERGSASELKGAVDFRPYVVFTWRHV